MSARQSAADFAIAIAHDDTHGYAQDNRYLNPDTDCSWLTIYSYKQAGVPLSCWSTRDMVPDMLENGFIDVTKDVNLKTGAGLKTGDVLQKTGHAAIYVGNGNIVECTCNEFGGITGGQPGDQTGTEIYEHGYYNPGWNYVLRYNESEGGYMFIVGTVQFGSQGDDVKLYQAILKGRGFKGKDGKVLTIDGIAGENTVYAITKFQESTKGALAVDGIGGALTSALLLYR